MAASRLDILNRAFIRVHRSFGLYLVDAWPVYDVADERTIQQIQERQRADADRMAETLIRERGAVDVGLPRIEFGDVHFLNLSSIVPTWIAEQRALVAGLEADVRDLQPTVDRVSGMVEQVLAHERDHLKRIEALAGVKVAA